MAFSRDDMASYEQQPQTMVEIVAVPVEVAADTPPPAENTEVDPAAAPAAEASDADDPADGGSSADDLEGEPATPSGEPSAATETPAKGSARARIMELVDERNSYREFGTVAQRENERLRAELAALKGDTPAAVDKTAVEPATAADADDVPPSPEDPDVMYDPVKLQHKNAKWMKEQIAKGVKAETAKASAESTQKAAVAETNKAFETRVKAYEGTEAGKDLRTLLSNKDLPHLATPATVLIVRDPLAPQILHEIAKDVVEAKRIAALPVAEQLVEVGEIRARVRAAAKAAPTTVATPAAKTVKQPKTVTSAPPPPTRVPAGTAPNTERPLTDPSLSMEDFVRRDREQKAAARTAKREARLGMR